MGQALVWQKRGYDVHAKNRSSFKRLARIKDTRVVHVDHLKPFEKDYEPAMDNQGLPPLVLDEDYLDVEVNTARDEILEPLLDRASSVPASTDSEPSVDVEAPGRSPADRRRSSRTTRAPRRYRFSSNYVAHISVRWS